MSQPVYAKIIDLGPNFLSGQWFVTAQQVIWSSFALFFQQEEGLLYYDVPSILNWDKSYIYIYIKVFLHAWYWERWLKSTLDLCVIKSLWKKGLFPPFTLKINIIGKGFGNTYFNIQSEKIICLEKIEIKN